MSTRFGETTLPDEVLSPFHRKILRIFASLDESSAFYFTGGMALSACHLRHRLSEDIDLFCAEEALISIVARKLGVALGGAGIEVEVVRSFGSFWEAVLKEGRQEIRLQLALDSPFQLAELVENEGVLTHSLPDLAAGKLRALFGRAEARDFVDVYCLVRQGCFTMEQLIEMARRNDPGLDEYYLAVAFEHAEDLPAHASELRLTLFQDIDMADLKAYFQDEAASILQRRLPPA